jgi:membrane-bound lytic murein transglycosylase D
LPLVVNDYVAAFINFFRQHAAGHNTLLHSFQRAGRYKAMIQRVMAEEGVPQDLIYLAVAESGFQPRPSIAAPAPAACGSSCPRQLRAGPQCLCGRALRSGEIHARLRPLHEVHLRPAGRLVPGHGRLRLGRGQCAARREKTGYADFWELYKRNNLPGETKNYVPEILAAIIIANHPTQYGFDDVTLDPPVLTDTVTINYSVDLRLVSDLVGAPVDELMALNPSLLRLVTPPDASFDLHLPAARPRSLSSASRLIPEGKRNAWRYHRVAARGHAGLGGARVSRDRAELAAANQLRESDSIAGRRGAGGAGAALAAPRRARCSTPRARAIRWSPSPIASASR